MTFAEAGSQNRSWLPAVGCIEAVNDKQAMYHHSSRRWEPALGRMAGRSLAAPRGSGRETTADKQDLNAIGILRGAKTYLLFQSKPILGKITLPVD